MKSLNMNIIITVAAILVSYGVSAFLPSTKTKIIAFGVGATIIFWIWLLGYANHRVLQEDIFNVQEQTPGPSFSVEVRSALVSDSGPLTLYMVGYPSVFGTTASPVLYLAFIQITNLQDVASTISELTVSASKQPDGPWETLEPIPLSSVRLFSLGAKTPSPKSVLFRRGTYRLAKPMTEEDMKNAAVINAAPVLSQRLGKPIQSHDTIKGWVALDPASHKGLTPGQIYFSVSILDTAGKGGNYVVPLPTKKDSALDVDSASIQVTGFLTDISQFKVKYYSDPFAAPDTKDSTKTRN